MSSRKVTICPRCKRPVQASDYYSTTGISDWRIETVGVAIRCPDCDYFGPPVELGIEEFKKLADSMRKKKEQSR